MWLEDTGGNYVKTLCKWGAIYPHDIREWAQASDLDADTRSTGCAPGTQPGTGPAQAGKLRRLPAAAGAQSSRGAGRKLPGGGSLFGWLAALLCEVASLRSTSGKLGLFRRRLLRS